MVDMDMVMELEDKGDNVDYVDLINNIHMWIC